MPLSGTKPKLTKEHRDQLRAMRKAFDLPARSPRPGERDYPMVGPIGRDWPRAEVQRRRRYAQRELERLKKRFQDTGNGLHAWFAIGECFDARVIFPPWVVDYLQDGVFEFRRLFAEPPFAGKIDAAVARAVKIAGKSRFNPFMDGRQVGHDYFLAFQVYQRQTANWHAAREQREPEHSWDAIFKDVAENHRCHQCKKQMTVGKVKQAWYRYAFDVIPAHLLTTAKSRNLDEILRRQPS